MGKICPSPPRPIRAASAGSFLHGPCRAAAALGPVRLAERGAPDRDQRHRLQLAAMPGEHRRSDAQRVGARASVQIHPRARRPPRRPRREPRPHAAHADQMGRRHQGAVRAPDPVRVREGHLLCQGARRRGRSRAPPFDGDLSVLHPDRQGRRAAQRVPDPRADGRHPHLSHLLPGLCGTARHRGAAPGRRAVVRAAEVRRARPPDPRLRFSPRMRWSGSRRAR